MITYEQASVILDVAQSNNPEIVRKNAEMLQKAFPEFEWEYMVLYTPFPAPIIQLRKRPGKD